MEIGKQSTLNDLKALKEYLENKMSEIDSIETGIFDNGRVSGGALNDIRQTGVYSLISGVTRPHNESGMLLQMTDSETGEASSTMLYLSWFGRLTLETKYGSNEVKNVEVLTSKNTITDSNGFIKAA